jgi:hypothetical protein
MNQLKLNPKTPGGIVRILSGVFISSSNPHGLTTKELKLVTLLLSILPNQEEITKEVKNQLCNMTNNKMQVMVNYLNILKKKGVIVKNRLHPIFYKQQILIEWTK